MLLSSFPRRGPFRPGPSTAVPRLVSARTVGSVPRLQAQVADINKVLENSNTNLPPSFHTRPVHGPTPLMTPRPVASALPQNQDEFWRKIPVWRDVSAKEFLSYSWSVCGPWFESAKLNLFLTGYRLPSWSRPSPNSTTFCKPFSQKRYHMTSLARGCRLGPSSSRTFSRA